MATIGWYLAAIKKTEPETEEKCHNFKFFYKN